MSTENRDSYKGRFPNVVLILADDQGWGDLSYTGNANLSTPNIDRLARDGAVFNNFYVQPLCAPTRAEILTGRYYPRTGVRGVTQRAECLNLDEVTIGDVFKASGYAVGCFGKWHSGSAYPYHPNGRGFDEFFGFCCGHWSHYFDSTLEHNGEEVKANGYITDVLTEKAMEFMEKNSHKPFLCYVPFNTPHSPFQVPDRWFNKFRNSEILMRCHNPQKENLDVTRSVLAMCENIDWNVGRLIAKIEELGLTQDTIIIYLSDNGPNGWRWNGGMSGIKGSADEGGVRSPCFIKWPGAIKSGLIIDQIAGAIDLLPTLSDLAGINMIKTKPLDGISLQPLLSEEDDNWPERSLFAHCANGRFTSIRTQRYRAGGNSGGLYDIESDRGQHNDLTHCMPGLAEKLKRDIQNWREDVIPKQIPDRDIPVGYVEFPKTYLNAQDGISSGSIKWSSIHPNASYFINWNSTNDEIYWDVDVQTSGEYEITLMYACASGDEGSEIEIEFNGSKVSAVIAEPFDTPLKDGCDRVKRTESYEKEFRPLCMGMMFIRKGKGKVRLRAISKSGHEICEVRAIKVELVEPYRS